MKIVFLLLLWVCVAFAASSSFFSVPGASSTFKSSSRSNPKPRSQDKVRSRSGKGNKVLQRMLSLCGSGEVDATQGGSEYHFSWCNKAFARTNFTGSSAENYCRSSAPGNGWRRVAIESSGENSFISGIISRGSVPYIWTDGQKRGSDWVWKADNSAISFNDWSHTGARKRPQPDNRGGDENCLAVLNSFYGDGIKWHDVGCSHKKPIICERSAK